VGQIIKKMSIYKDITLIIVCFNSEKLIEKNLEKLKKFKVILIDNSNSQKTYELINQFTNIKYIAMKENVGFGRANNIGVKNAETPFILILNPDILIDVDAIQILYDKYHIYENVGILAPSLYNQNKIRRTNGSISRLKSNYKSNPSDVLPEFDTCYDYIIGCSIFINTTFFKTIGGFDEDFFMYFEDNEICDRVHKYNKSVIEIPDAKMVHLQGLSSNADIFTSIKLSVIHKISEYIYYNKNFSKFKLYSIILKHFLDYLQRSIINLFLFRFKKFLKNFFRLISIFLYISKLYRLIY
jgi:GT2 family glycosyltransferase